MAESSRTVAVLTGDVVNSTKVEVEDRQRMLDVVTDATSTARDVFGAEVPYETDIFRGDSWQMLCSRPARSVAIAVLIRARLIADGFDTRVSIGIGGVDVLSEVRVSHGAGEAFVISGRGLESMPPTRKMTIGWSDEVTGPSLDPVLCLLDTILGRWTGRQALALGRALQGHSQSRIAKDLGVSQQAVSNHLSAAGFASVRDGIGYTEEAIEFHL